jgi:hypothetical protein
MVTDSDAPVRATTLDRPEPVKAAAADRALLERRARRLAAGGNLWHGIEFAVALAAGIAAGSVALIAFGIDSVIEMLAGE